MSDGEREGHGFTLAKTIALTTHVLDQDDWRAHAGAPAIYNDADTG
jgi:hypothetical protein